MPLIETKINRFDGGIVFDPRNTRENVARAISNFDVITNARKMTPYRDSESGDSDATTQRIQNFTIAFDNTNYLLYGLGVVSGTTRAKIFQRALSSFEGLTWVASTAGEDGTAGSVTNNNLFVYYRRTALIYGARDGTNIWAFSPTGTAFASSSQALTYTNIAQGLVHSKDDILYIPYDNIIARNNNGVWTTAALTLPTYLYITSISEYGNFLAIACRPLSGIGNSRVYLWDRDSSLTTISESIDWGSGMLQILEEVDGELLGISLTSVDSNIRFNSKVTFRQLIGNKAVKLFEFIGDMGQTATELPIAKQKVDNRLYFLMMIYFADANRHGVWSISRPNPNAPFILVNERLTDNDVAIVSADTLLNFHIVEDYTFISYQDNGVYTMSKTIDTGVFTATSIYESKIYDGTHKGFDASFYKDLKEATVTTEFLPTAGQITLKYRVNQTTTWTTIFVNTTDNSISHTAKNFEGRTATMTIASPAVVTLTAHGLVAGDMIYFTTTGALPTGVTANTTYFVIATGLAADSFQFSATSGGSAVNSSGTQSGTHTLIRRNAALPNDYKQIQFRVESTGNAEPTGLIFKEDVKTRRFNTA